MPPLSAAMRPLLVSTLVLATSAALALGSATPRSAQAATGVARCEMPDGTYAYTNSSCATLSARHAPLPAEVMNRIQRELRHEAQMTGTPVVDNGLVATTLPAGPRRPLSQGCATTPRQLALDLRASMAMGDVNRIAESFDWAGMTHAQAMQEMARIERLGGLWVADAEYFDAGFGIAAATAGGTGTLQVVLQEANARTVADFDVRRTSGCYFLRHTWAA